jgi:hypothetical protein
MASLPRHRSDAWLGGFAIDAPVYTSSISASGGSVVAATVRLYRLRPGTTRFGWWDPPPEGHGDITCVAVEPRRPGQPARFAYAACPNSLYLVDDERVVPIELPLEEGEEIHGLMWAPATNGDDPTRRLLHLFVGDRVLRLLPYDGGPNYEFEGSFWPTRNDDDEDRPVCAMASDGESGVAFATFDEERWELEVSVYEGFESNLWITRWIEAPSFVSGVRLAVAGTAVAVAFEMQEGVWLSRKLREPIERVDALRGKDVVLAFGGASTDAPLFAAMRETPLRAGIARVDAEGRCERIAELELTIEGDEKPPVLPLIHEMAWDETRRTLWSAAGRAGIMCSTEPGAAPVLGEMGAKRAMS